MRRNPDQHGIAIKVKKVKKKKKRKRERKKESSGQRQSECLLFHASPRSPRENYPAILVEGHGLMQTISLGNEGSPRRKSALTVEDPRACKATKAVASKGSPTTPSPFPPCLWWMCISFASSPDPTKPPLNETLRLRFVFSRFTGLFLQPNGVE